MMMTICVFLLIMCVSYAEEYEICVYRIKHVSCVLHVQESRDRSVLWEKIALNTHTNKTTHSQTHTK